MVCAAACRAIVAVGHLGSSARQSCIAREILCMGKQVEHIGVGTNWRHNTLALLVQHMLHGLLRVERPLAMAKRVARGKQKA